eukprot:3765552-Rhodomonas_salina.2
MAQALDVRGDKAVVFNVEMQLTLAEACMSNLQCVAQARATFEDCLDAAASSFHALQVLGCTRSLNGSACKRQLLADFSGAAAAVQMLIVYKEDGAAMCNAEALASAPAITAVAVDASSAANVKVDATRARRSQREQQQQHGADRGDCWRSRRGGAAACGRATAPARAHRGRGDACGGAGADHQRPRPQGAAERGGLSRHCCGVGSEAFIALHVRCVRVQPRVGDARERRQRRRKATRKEAAVKRARGTTRKCRHACCGQRGLWPLSLRTPG